MTGAGHNYIDSGGWPRVPSRNSLFSEGSQNEEAYRRETIIT